ncbi:hydrolase [Sporanaerobium hydrogeniformans]|uniref:Hydrolase n=1 Tax=Sporanaerobium hydrogeniformans TaxID=3072179 RepID=A0AC61DC45_9FIRM|nr:UxaA family hydrolase [Sporanaerobium hydrogeniformans]PHV70102.1 hydrolase [Sporanaerobium hydrogeniformans]
MSRPFVFQIAHTDNVATALAEVKKGEIVGMRGDSDLRELIATTDIPKGHKIAIRTIAKEEPILKYGVVIGKATEVINKGSWVHLHCMCSIYDERSSHLDVHTGAPCDIDYE